MNQAEPETAWTTATRRRGALFPGTMRDRGWLVATRSLVVRAGLGRQDSPTASLTLGLWTSRDTEEAPYVMPFSAPKRGEGRRPVKLLLVGASGPRLGSARRILRVINILNIFLNWNRFSRRQERRCGRERRRRASATTTAEAWTAGGGRRAWPVWPGSLATEPQIRQVAPGGLRQA